jgi:hypothetical protein
MRSDRGGEVRQRIEFLELTRPHNRQEALDGALAIVAPRAEHDFSPLHRSSKGAFGGIVRGSNALLVHEGEEVLIVHEERRRQVPDVLVGGVQIPLAKRKEPFLKRQNLVDQLCTSEWRATRIGVAAKAMPEPKQAPVERQRLAAEAFRRRRRRKIERAEKIPGDVGPAKLSLADDVFEIAGQAVTPQDARERLAQDGLQHVSAAGRGNAIHHERTSDERPEPPFIAVGPVSGLVGIDDRFLPQRRFKFDIRRRDRRTRFFPCVLSTPQADRDLQRALKEPLHDQAGQAAHDSQIRNQGDQLRTKLPNDVLRQHRKGQPAALATSSAMAAIFCDVRLDCGELRHLMPPWLARLIARVQHPLAVETALGHQIDRRVHAFDGNHRARMTGMARLAAWPAMTPLSSASDALTPRKAIGRGRLGTRGRILLPQGELPFQIGDSFFVLGVFAPQALVLFAEAFEFACVSLCVVAFGMRPVSFTRRPMFARHAGYGTPIESTCTDP